MAKQTVGIPALVNVVTGGTSSDDAYVTLNPHLFMIYEPNEWLVDNGANVHLCADRSNFVSYQVIHDCSVTMENGSTARVMEIGLVNLKFASGRVLSLHRVHHVPSVRRNILSGSCLVREGYELNFKCNKVVILHLKSFIGKGYLSYGLFKLYVNHVWNKNLDVDTPNFPNVM